MIDIRPGGEAVAITARVYNATRIVDEFHVAVIGTGQWLDAQPARIRLFPDTDGTVEISVSIPKDRLVTAGRRTVGVKATSVSNPQVTGTERVEVNVVEVVAGVAIKLEPTVVHGGQDAELLVTVSNGGNTALDVVLLGEDPEREVAFVFQPTGISVPPAVKDGPGFASRRSGLPARIATASSSCGAKADTPSWSRARRSSSARRSRGSGSICCASCSRCSVRPS